MDAGLGGLDARNSGILDIVASAYYQNVAFLVVSVNPGYSLDNITSLL